MSRFTLDGSDELERHLAQTCEKVRAGVEQIVPPGKLEALVLGGGYGRGEGGVLRTGQADHPYNDLEFYVFLRGHRLWNRRKFGRALHELGGQLSPAAGLPVEFKVDSLTHFRRSPVTMFSYDLVSGHKVLAGDAAPFVRCEHHLAAAEIPLAEATRLLMNRCSGLLFAREKLAHDPFAADDADFICRNIAKAQLALGDALLAVFGQYHWSCLERHCQLVQLAVSYEPPWLAEVQRQHAAGVQFKLHPHGANGTRDWLRLQLGRITALALQVWLWLENRRLGCRFESARDYALSLVNKCPGTNPWRNLLLNVKVFNPAVVLHANRCRHPSEMILNALALLLWAPETSNDGFAAGVLNLFSSRTAANRNPVTAYQAIWRKLN